MLQSPKICREIFSKDVTVRSPDLGLGDLFKRWLGYALGAVDSRNPAWGQIKKIFKPVFDSDMPADNLINDYYLNVKAIDGLLSGPKCSVMTTRFFNVKII